MYVGCVYMCAVHVYACVHVFVLCVCVNICIYVYMSVLVLTVHKEAGGAFGVLLCHSLQFSLEASLSLIYSLHFGSGEALDWPACERPGHSFFHLCSAGMLVDTVAPCFQCGCW